MKNTLKKFFLVPLFLAGCATAPEPSGPEPGAPEPSAPEAPSAGAEAPRAGENVAVAGLMKSARADTRAGRLGSAAASLERALRIEPRNPRLWQQLARVRLQQGEYAQAESVAARANTWAGTDNALRAQNWRLIAQAREARGNGAGARAALEAAAKLER